MVILFLLSLNKIMVELKRRKALNGLPYNKNNNPNKLIIAKKSYQ